jgi:hypothetical protein
MLPKAIIWISAIFICKEMARPRQEILRKQFANIAEGISERLFLMTAYHGN